MQKGLEHTTQLYVKNTASQGSANGSASGRPEAPKFGQLAGRSVVNIPSDYHLFSFYSLKPALGSWNEPALNINIGWPSGTFFGG